MILSDIKRQYEHRLMLTGCTDTHDFIVVYNNAIQSLNKLDQEPEGSDRKEWIRFHLNIVQQAIDTLPEWAERHLTKEALEERYDQNYKLMNDHAIPERIRRVAEQRVMAIKKELEAIKS